ncbi:stage III sporulation protein AF [Gracilibacillus marinus]|jgi:stage III sporulation protein AF|uniref:Stage III sporulation protein AF n=1 Tax=Gracilibacillus marinus TaxID=630535 RepID=A0ABV8VZB7_9BACI
MDYITNWIIQIVIYMLLALIVDLILPNSKLKQYAKLVIGLLLMLIILQPILSIMNINMDKLIAPLFETNELHHLSDVVENKTNQKKSEIEMIHHAYVVEEVVVQMEKMVEGEMKDEYDVMITHLDVNFENEQSTVIQEVTVYLQEFEMQQLKPVETVSIQIGNETPNPNTYTFTNKELTNFLGNTWGISTDQITLKWEEEE